MQTGRILELQEHRPWPAPESPWVMQMRWHDLLFAHWAVDVDRLRALTPPQLELDTFDGQAWLGVVPFRMTGVRPRFVPEFPPLTSFLELNVRTYVISGGKPGVWFFSLDAASRLAVRGARWSFHLPYFDAEMSLNRDGDRRHYRSRRTHRNAPTAEFVGSYWPTGPGFQSTPGTLEHWLTERYCLYAVDRKGKLWRGEIHHPQWPLQPAAAELSKNTMAQPLGFSLDDMPQALHFAERIDVIAWPLAAAQADEPTH